MLIILLSITITVVCFLLALLLNKKKLFSYSRRDDITAVLSIFIIVFGIISIVCILTAFFICLGTDKQIYENELKRESIVKQLEAVNSNYEDVSKVDVIEQVYDYNADVHNEKYWASNIWTNWFYNQEVVDALEYIEMED